MQYQIIGGWKGGHDMDNRGSADDLRSAFFII